MVNIKIWRKHKPWTEAEYEADLNQMETIESYIELLDTVEGTGEPAMLVITKESR